MNRISLEADILKEAHPEGSVPSFESLMQADFILYLRFHTIRSPSSNWYPHSLVYAARRFSPFPLFARAESLTFFNEMRPILAVESLDQFKQKTAEMMQGERSNRLFDYQGLGIGRLANLPNLGSLP
ncbi:hypothetical protein PFY01_09175 [Brevundimonas vesicularis]|uniref:hypothetical protein n=1 Tax=Brevundimonas vesicularis TaxID=41276 RepID=UPI0022EC42CE|nr:hypothetical protein [Brevundimonas vesicularis]WBT04913.1 hypothetical protein PFY01_09175 [Brevundimonas vesicularis]